MKKFLMMLLSLVMVVFTSIGLIACGETITVELDNDGKKQTLEVNDEFTAPQDPVKEGHTFLGWFLDGSDTPFDFNTKIEASIVLVAKWQINQYTISFDSGVNAITQNYGTAVTAPTAPTKTGYTFAGWFEEGATEAYAFDTIEARNVALVAKWNIAQFTITFNTDGGTAIAPITGDYNTAVTAPVAPTKTGYTFAGWDVAVPETMPAENVTITAQWTVNAYSISFDANGGSAVASITQNYGTAVTAPTAPTKTGYTFAGWFEEGATEAYAFATIEARNVELVARWNIAQFTITFNTDGGTAIAPITKDYNSAVTAPVAPTKTGYTFAGWNATIPETMPAENVTITANWTVNQYTITFNTNGGSAIAPITGDYGTAISAPVAPTKTAYTFAGWNVAVPETMPAENITITANWDATTYSIIVDVNGGEVENFAKIDYTIEDAPIVITAVPNRSASEFVGWFGVKVVGGTTYYVGADYLAGTGSPKTDLSDASLDAENSIKGFDPAVFANNEFYHDVKLIAKWIGEEFTITYDVKGGNALAETTQAVRYGEEYTLAVPTRDNYEFQGWFIEGTNTKLNEGTWTYETDVDVYAKWGNVFEKTYALYKLNDEHTERVENDEEIVIDGFANITRAQIVEAMKGADLESAEDDVAIGGVVEIVLENTDTAYVVAKVTVITGFINDVDDLANMTLFADYMEEKEVEIDDNKDGVVDRIVTNYMKWTAHLVLTNDIDVAGVNIKKNTSPGTLTNSPAFGFYGVLDGAGHTIINLEHPIFWQLGDWGGTVKNLSLINASAPLANCLGEVTIDNCYFEFVLDKIYTLAQPYAHLIGHSVGDTYNREFTLTNTVIKVENNTTTKVNIVNNITENTTVKVENVVLVGAGDYVGICETGITAGVTAIGLTDAYEGSVEGFDESIWDTTGNHPIFKNSKYTVVDRPFGYGRYILDRENDNATKINDQDFVATVAEGVTVTIDKSVFNIGANGMNASPNSSKWKKLVKGTDGKYYKVNIEFVNFAINDAIDAANIAKGLNQPNWATAQGAGSVIMFNNDIDMTGMTMYMPTTGAYSGGWGYQGTILGNGRTISNLNTTLIPYINNQAVIKDLNFVNMKEGGSIAYKSSGAQISNVNFEINALGLSSVTLVGQLHLSRKATTLTDCSVVIKNASDSFVCKVDYGPNASYENGTITLNNVSVTMNAGSFKLAGTEASEGDLTGMQNKTIVNAVLDKTK